MNRIGEGVHHLCGVALQRRCAVDLRHENDIVGAGDDRQNISGCFLIIGKCGKLRAGGQLVLRFQLIDGIIHRIGLVVIRNQHDRLLVFFRQREGTIVVFDQCDRPFCDIPFSVVARLRADGIDRVLNARFDIRAVVR